MFHSVNSTSCLVVLLRPAKAVYSKDRMRVYGQKQEALFIQLSPVTVTPSGQGKTVTVSKCHSNKTFVL